jgi:hypothetical protein
MARGGRRGKLIEGRKDRWGEERIFGGGIGRRRVFEFGVVAGDLVVVFGPGKSQRGKLKGRRGGVTWGGTPRSSWMKAHALRR